MTKLLSLLSLTTALSTTSVLPLVQENNNQISTKQNTNSNEITIDNINEKMSITAEAGTDDRFDMSGFYKKILHLPWEEANAINSAVATNYFTHVLSSITITYNQLLLEKQESQDSNKISLHGLSMETTRKNGVITQMSNIYVSVTLEKIENNPELTQAIIMVISTAETVNSDKSCTTEYFLNKVILNK